MGLFAPPWSYTCDMIQPATWYAQIAGRYLLTAEVFGAVWSLEGLPQSTHLEFIQSNFRRAGGLWSGNVVPSPEANF